MAALSVAELRIFKSALQGPIAFAGKFIPDAGAMDRNAVETVGVKIAPRRIHRRTRSKLLNGGASEESAAAR